jgi:hypothetical protein
MRKTFLPTLLVSALAMAVLCGPTAAAPPSSNSAINEYQETLPGPGGGQASNGGNHGGGGTQGANQTGSSNNSSGGGSSASSPLPARAVRQLAAHGAPGKALSDLAQKTGSVAGSGSGKGSDTAAGSGMGGGSSGFLDSVGRALSDFIRGSDTGLGAGFPILLAVALLGAVGVLMTRHHRGQGPRTDT